MEIEKTAVGIELGSTRIKAVLIDMDHRPLASGDFEWENELVDGIWTYSLDEVRTGLRECFAALKDDFRSKYDTALTTTGAIGISAMMHGYLPLDKNDEELVRFRTWRNTTTGKAAEALTGLFGFNIPQRWSVAHLYQAILNREAHVKDIAFLATLAGYVHMKLTGVKAVGIGEASGMFPVDSNTLDYDEKMLGKFRELTGTDLRRLLPGILKAGERAGVLTQEGALYLDPTGEFLPGVPFVPCEGDAGTGMVATNSVRAGTGNVSAGTSTFAMIVTEKIPGVHKEIDMVTTPDGSPVAMVHCNNCTSDLNAWVNLFAQFAERMGFKTSKGELYEKLFNASLSADPDCGDLLLYNYVSGESITDLDEGRPLFVRTADSDFTLANFMRTQLYSCLATLKIGMDILKKEEIPIERLYGHGGLFKTPLVGQRILSAAVDAPVSVMETAGEGGPYGMALLAVYMLQKGPDETLADFLDQRVFAGAKAITVRADSEDVAGFDRYIARFKKALPLEKKAVEVL